MPHPGDWTLETARAALPEVRSRLAVARAHLAAMRSAEEQLTDLRIVHGEQVLASASPGHKEFRGYWEQYHQARADLEQAVLGLHQMGVEVKDVEQGLVDFRGMLGTVPAYLCWKDGEDDIAWWHPLDEGFQGRRRLP
jgi:arsenite methyltransferase